MNAFWLMLTTVVGVFGTAPKLTSYNVDTSQITVSGFSSGGYFAVQFHVAYSKIIRGAGVIAGGPFWCAQNNLSIAFSSCMKQPELISVAQLVVKTYSLATTGDIDSTSYLKSSQVYTISGEYDDTITPGVVKKLAEYYSEFVTEGNINSIYTLPAEHCFPTEDYGNACGYLGSPYINKCGFAAAREILLHMYPGSHLSSPYINKCGLVAAQEILLHMYPGSHQPLSSYHAENLYEFDQSEFYIEELSSMDATGYIYVPTVCQSQRTPCKLHIAFHGCLQGKMYLQDEYPSHTGYAQNAEGLRTIVLFPQAINSTLNPNGCWDWWGFTSPAYASKLGLQMVAVRRMVERIAHI